MTLAVVPAAGRGSRLGISGPKILAPIDADRTVWSILREKLQRVADGIVLILSPEGARQCRAVVASDRTVTVVEQPEPLGMGDAIFRGFSVWEKAPRILVVWGDQIFVSQDTLERALDVHGNAPKTVVIPVVAQPSPYVDYVFTLAGGLETVLQRREGDQTRSQGLSDVGSFVLSTSGLRDAWEDYVATTALGAATNELNFLPFFAHLGRAGWTIKRVVVADEREARGINTQEDLAFFRSLYGAAR